jgi:hypothetical protein
MIPKCDVTYRRHGSKIEHGIRGKFADTVGVVVGQGIAVRTGNYAKR